MPKKIRNHYRQRFAGLWPTMTNTVEAVNERRRKLAGKTTDEK